MYTQRRRHVYVYGPSSWLRSNNQLFFACCGKKRLILPWLAAQRGCLVGRLVGWAAEEFHFQLISLISFHSFLNQPALLSFPAFIPLFSSFCFACWDGVPAPITHLFQPAERAGWLGPPNQSKGNSQIAEGPAHQSTHNQLKIDGVDGCAAQCPIP